MIDSPVPLDMSLFPRPTRPLGAQFTVRNGVIVHVDEEVPVSEPAPPAAAAAASVLRAVVGGAGGPAPAAVPLAPRTYAVSTLPLEERYALCRSVGAECVQVGGLAGTEWAVTTHTHAAGFVCVCVASGLMWGCGLLAVGRRRRSCLPC